MQIKTGEELLPGSGAEAAAVGIASDNALGGGDSEDGVIELRIEEVDDESSSSRKAETRGRFEVGGQISSSLSESNVMQSTVFSAGL